MKRLIGMDGQEIKTALGKNIKSIRSQRQYSQADLAEKANISITFLSNIERGVKFPKPAVLSQIAHSLGVEVCELFKTEPAHGLAPLAASPDTQKLINRLSKDVSQKVNKAVNQALEGVFNHYLRLN